ncbi:MAG: fatty acid desaturase [Rhodospirillaceae bacterium]|nr:fatty acid desaturase [Rhodospirillaceae bacterium]
MVSRRTRIFSGRGTRRGRNFSHETAHGTAFRNHWLNETVLWTGSLIYMEEPLHRRYTHTNHHTFTWHVGKDSQMPFNTPMTLGGWLAEVSGFGLMRLQASRLPAGFSRPAGAELPRWRL